MCTCTKGEGRTVCTRTKGEARWQHAANILIFQEQPWTWQGDKAIRPPIHSKPSYTGVFCYLNPRAHACPNCKAASHKVWDTNSFTAKSDTASKYLRGRSKVVPNSRGDSGHKVTYRNCHLNMEGKSALGCFFLLTLGTSHSKQLTNFPPLKIPKTWLGPFDCTEQDVCIMQVVAALMFGLVIPFTSNHSVHSWTRGLRSIPKEPKEGSWTFWRAESPCSKQKVMACTEEQQQGITHRMANGKVIRKSAGHQRSRVPPWVLEEWSKNMMQPWKCITKQDKCMLAQDTCTKMFALCSHKDTSMDSQRLAQTNTPMDGDLTAQVYWR